MAEVYKVRKTEYVEFFVKADNEDQLQEWLNCNSIRDTRNIGDIPSTKYRDEILFPVDGYADIDISEESI